MTGLSLRHLARTLPPRHRIGTAHGLPRTCRVTGGFDTLGVAGNAHVRHLGATEERPLGRVTVEPGGRFQSLRRGDGLSVDVTTGDAFIGEGHIEANGHVVVEGQHAGRVTLTGGGLFDVNVPIDNVLATGPGTRVVFNTRAAFAQVSDGATADALHGVDVMFVDGANSRGQARGTSGWVVARDGGTAVAMGPTRSLEARGPDSTVYAGRQVKRVRAIGGGELRSLVSRLKQE